MSLDLEGTIPALAKHRGAGRVNAARLVEPAADVRAAGAVVRARRAPGETKRMTITATDMRESGANDRLRRQHACRSSATRRSRSTDAVVLVRSGAGARRSTVNLATAGAPAGDYEGFVEITGGGQTYTIPYFVRVQDPAAAKDVLLIDWDRNLGGATSGPSYTARSRASASASTSSTAARSPPAMPARRSRSSRTTARSCSSPATT